MMSPSSASVELAVRHLDVLDRAEDVGELQAQELDPLPLGQLEDLLLQVRLHVNTPFARQSTRQRQSAPPGTRRSYATLFGRGRQYKSRTLLDDDLQESWLVWTLDASMQKFSDRYRIDTFLQSSATPSAPSQLDRWTRPDLIGSSRVGLPREAGETHQPSGSDLVRLVRGASDGAEIAVGIICDRGPQTLKGKLDEPTGSARRRAEGNPDVMTCRATMTPGRPVGRPRLPRRPGRRGWSPGRREPPPPAPPHIPRA